MKKQIQELRLHRFGDKVAIDYRHLDHVGREIQSETYYLGKDLAHELATALWRHKRDIDNFKFQDSPLGDTLVPSQTQTQTRTEMNDTGPSGEPADQTQGNSPAFCPDTGYPLPDDFSGIKIDKTRFRYQDTRTWPSGLQQDRSAVDNWKFQNDELKRQGKPVEAKPPGEQPTGGGDANPNGPGAQAPATPTPKPKRGTTGEPSGITPMDVTRGAVVFGAPEGSFQAELTELIEKHGIAHESDTPSAVLGAHLAATANQFNTVTRKRDATASITITPES